MKNLRNYIVGLALIFIISCSFSACIDRNTNNSTPTPPKKESIVAIVFADLTGSINEETANRVKTNVGELFQKLPADTKFFLYSVDKGTSKPHIYNFAETLPEVRVVSDQEKLKTKIAEIVELKRTTEFEKLNSSLNDYQNSISSQKGAVSCLSNKFNYLSDLIKNNSDDHPEYAIRVYFYSDMLEECEKSFDGKPLDFKKKTGDAEEEKHLQEIEDRIDKGFSSTLQFKDFKSVGTKFHIILTSQDEKQELEKLKIIWARIFGKFGYSKEDINNSNYFYWGGGNGDSLWELK